LQQTHRGGLGVVVFKTAKHGFNFEASADDFDQQFASAILNKRLFGSIFSSRAD
jgi:hypothetical protein